MDPSLGERLDSFCFRTLWHRALRGSSVLLVMACLLGAESAHQTDDAALLSMVADEYQVNMEKLRTWRGRIVVHKLFHTGKTNEHRSEEHTSELQSH